jgi:hypothetical protein
LIFPDESGNENPKWSAPRQIDPGIMLDKPVVLPSGAWLPESSVEELRLGYGKLNARVRASLALQEKTFSSAGKCAAAG